MELIMLTNLLPGKSKNKNPYYLFVHCKSVFEITTDFDL